MMVGRAWYGQEVEKDALATFHFLYPVFIQTPSYLGQVLWPVNPLWKLPHLHPKVCFPDLFCQLSIIAIVTVITVYVYHSLKLALRYIFIGALRDCPPRHHGQTALKL